MEHRQHCGRCGTSRYDSREPEGDAKFGVDGLDTTVRTSLDHQRVRFASTDEAEMAVMMVRTDVAMKKWLGIVGAAKRDGQTAVSHQRG